MVMCDGGGMVCECVGVLWDCVCVCGVCGGVCECCEGDGKGCYLCECVGVCGEGFLIFDVETRDVKKEYSYMLRWV